MPMFPEPDGLLPFATCERTMRSKEVLYVSAAGAIVPVREAVQAWADRVSGWACANVIVRVSLIEGRVEFA